ncbi:MAG: hypothetical protein ACR2HX_15750 [Pyrinomonadaceae bacterium]
MLFQTARRNEDTVNRAHLYEIFCSKAMHRIKIEPMPGSEVADPCGLWRVVVLEYEEPGAKIPLFVNVVEDNLLFKEACEIIVDLEKGFYTEGVS